MTPSTKTTAKPAKTVSETVHLAKPPALPRRGPSSHLRPLGLRLKGERRWMDQKETTGVGERRESGWGWACWMLLGMLQAGLGRRFFWSWKVWFAEWCDLYHASPRPFKTVDLVLSFNVLAKQWLFDVIR